MAPSTDPDCIVYVSYLVNETCGRMISHLINYLRMDGIGAVIGSVEIEPGKPMDAMLRRLIENCDIYVIFFSENYAISNTRLWEVTAIAEVAEAMGKRILPVFYDVTVEDVKLQTGRYIMQLSQHPAESEATIEEWSNALRGIGQILGLNRPTSDADLCQEICGRVRDLINEKDQSVITLNATFKGCPYLNLEDLEFGSTSRTFLTIENCGTTSLFRRSQSRNLIENITIRNCHKLKEVPFGQLKSLKVFDIKDCTSIEKMSDVANAGELEELRIVNCPNLKVIEDLEEVAGSVKFISIHNCGSPIASSSTSLTETTQNEDVEELTIQELDRLIELD